MVIFRDLCLLVAFAIGAYKIAETPDLAITIGVITLVGRIGIYMVGK